MRYERHNYLQGCKPEIEIQEAESTIKSLAGCIYAKAAIEVLEEIFGPQCRVMATRQLAEIPLGFYSAIIMRRLFGMEVSSPPRGRHRGNSSSIWDHLHIQCLAHARGEPTPVLKECPEFLQFHISWVL